VPVPVDVVPDPSPPCARAPPPRGIAYPLPPVAPLRREPSDSLRPLEELPPLTDPPPDDWLPPAGALELPPPLGA
jgi:hypothetical protein